MSPSIAGPRASFELPSADPAPATPDVRTRARVDEMKGALAELRAEYLEELPGKLQYLVDVLARVRRAPGDAALRREARSRAHQLHGTGGSYGFASLGAAAGHIEHALAAVDAGELSLEQAWPRIDGALAEATAALAEAIRGVAPDGGGPQR